MQDYNQFFIILLRRLQADVGSYITCVWAAETQREEASFLIYSGF